MIINLQQDMSRLIELNTKLSTSVDDLKAKNSTLVSQMKSLSSTLTSTPMPQPLQTKLNIPNLLIGDSIIRDVACTDPKALHIVSRGGAKTGDILQSLRKMKTDSFGDVILHVGTNDCSTKFPVEKIGNNICDFEGIRQYDSSDTGHSDNVNIAAEHQEPAEVLSQLDNTSNSPVYGEYKCC